MKNTLHFAIRNSQSLFLVCRPHSRLTFPIFLSPNFPVPNLPVASPASSKNAADRAAVLTAARPARIITTSAASKSPRSGVSAPSVGQPSQVVNSCLQCELQTNCASSAYCPLPTAYCYRTASGVCASRSLGELPTARPFVRRPAWAYSALRRDTSTRCKHTNRLPSRSAQVLTGSSVVCPRALSAGLLSHQNHSAAFGRLDPIKLGFRF